MFKKNDVNDFKKFFWFNNRIKKKISIFKIQKVTE